MTERASAEYWHHKHPVGKVTYKGRPSPYTSKNFTMDVRDFVWASNGHLLDYAGKYGLVSFDPDDAVELVHKHISKKYIYKSDETLGRSEYWLFPSEFMHLKCGDCEDGAIFGASLLYNILPESLHWRLRVAAGMVGVDGDEGGHCWLTWLRSSDWQWVAVDWCYWSDYTTAIEDRTPIRDRPEYKTTWWSFNNRDAYTHVNQEVVGRVNES